MNLKSFRHPDLYHGRLSKNYFEGWYFKLVDREMKRAFAFIPGIFFSSIPQDGHAFIQIVDGMKKTYNYVRFSSEEFSASKNIFALNIAGNYFSINKLACKLDVVNTKISGELKFTNHVHWPDSLLNPGSMGFYNYIIRMQCYSQVCAMDFDLTGTLKINGELIDFNGGRGYIEKNWGSAFPYSWVWVQCNHFGSQRASLSCSLGHIPFPVSSFRGFLVGLYVGEKFYEFTTMNRSKVEVIQKGTDISLQLINHRHSLAIDCKTNSKDFILLHGPRGDQMIPLVQENLQGLVNITLQENSSGRTIYSDHGCCAGVEYGGDQMMVIDHQTQGDGRAVLTP